MDPPPSSIALIVALGLLGGCGGEDATSSTTDPAPAVAAGPTDTERPEPEQGGAGAETENDDPAGRDPAEPADPDKRETAAGAEDAYRAYVDAINERDGEALCSLLASDAVRGLRPPVDRGSCARSLTASIGYEDPRGFPVWERTVLNGIESVSVGDDPGTVRLTAETLTEFADRAEPSVESDVAYLELAGGRWRLAQPTAAIYRAIGRPELPPSVIAPPPG